jgi:proteasome assembly chaperone (PAC2) family protein
VEHVRWEAEVPELRSPTLVCAFAGWNDAAGAASTALETIAGGLESHVVATLDPEHFYDFQVNRPTIRLIEGSTRHVDWPENTFTAAPIPGADHDFILMTGVEPNLRWRTYSAAILDVAERMGATMLISLGALIADVAHTLPVPITGLASDESLVEELGLSRSNYEGPTGIVGVLHDQARERGMSSASLWAAVPHYVAAVPNPKAALALLRRLEGLTGVALEASELEEAMERFEGQVNRAVSANPEIEELVRRLESEQGDEIELPEVPSGDALARDFQRYLRQRSDDEPDEPPTPPTPDR